MTLNNNSNYSLCLDGNFSPLCNNSYESLLSQNFSKNKRNYPLPYRGSHVLGGGQGAGRQLFTLTAQLCWGLEALYQ